MNKVYLKQSFLAAFASALAGLSLYYIFAFWFNSDDFLNTIEFLLLATIIMPLSIGFFLVIFSLHFLSDYYKENINIKGYRTFFLLFIFTGLMTILLDEAYFLINKDVPNAFVRVYNAIDEQDKKDGKKSIGERLEEDNHSIEEIGDYAPWYMNMIGLAICIGISSGISILMLKRSTKKINEYL